MMKTIGVIGESEATRDKYELAYNVGREIARRGYVLVSGGLSGIMEGACRGAKEEGGITVGVLPGTNYNEANPYVDIPIVTGMSHARNVIVVRSSRVIIAIGGSFGTLSEIAIALKIGVPVVGLKTWEVSDEIRKAATPQEAVELACSLANNSGG